jgi:mannose-1-phosphate guanylyltransferase
MMEKTDKPGFARADNEWAVILAGGDGTRLKSLTRQITGDERPKQFCSVMGGATLLEETQRRVALELDRERILYVVNRAHEPYYSPILGDRPRHSLVVQPCNRGTAPAILYSLVRIAATDSSALVAFLPCDHYISDNGKFMDHVRAALDAARRRPELVILLGVEPESPEVEYGWIESGERLPGSPGLCCVRRFWEKPNQLRAQVLMLRGCLWNSFVMVSSVRALLQIIASALPDLYDSFLALQAFFATPGEAGAMARLYASIEEMNFSHQVLALQSRSLAVLRVSGVRWNDLGEPKRVLASLNMAGVRPHWAEAMRPQFA